MRISQLFKVIINNSRLEIILLFSLILLNSILEFIQIGFLSYIATRISSEQVLKGTLDSNYIYTFLDSLSISRLIISLMMMLFVIAVLRVTIVIQTKTIATNIGHKLSIKAFDNLLYSPYSFLKKIKFAKIQTKLLFFKTFINGVLQPLLECISSIFFAVAILFSAGLFGNLSVLISIFSLAFMYIFIYKICARIIIKQEAVQAIGEEQYNQDILHSFYDIRQLYYGRFPEIQYKKYSKNDYIYRYCLNKIAILRQTPKYLIEGLGLVILIGIFALFSGNFTDSSKFPSFIITLFAIQKLLPLFQLIFVSRSSVLANRHIIKGVFELLNIKNEKINYLKAKKKNYKNKIVNSIKLTNLSFSYDESSSNKILLNNINHEFKLGKVNFILGRSGIGKSTILDLISNLLKLDSGEIKFYLKDNRSLSINIQNKNIVNGYVFRNLISYVSQKPFIFQDSLAFNIALKKYHELNNREKDKILSILNILNLDYLNNKKGEVLLKSKIQANGIVLSGGQIQRLSLAKALYEEKPIMLLDEPTNALDNNNIKNIQKIIKTESKFRLIIVITHNESIINKSDNVLKL